MSQSGLSTFDHTLHATHIWLSELMSTLGWEERQHAYHALRATLQVLRDQLTIEEVADLGAQLPMLVRGFYYEGWKPGRSQRARKKQEFLDRVASKIPFQLNHPMETVVREVFGVLSSHISQVEIDDVKNILSRKCRELWEE